MPVYFSSLFGSASIGVYALATDKVAIIPSLASIKKAQKLAEWLKVELIHTSVSVSILIGALACANSKGIILPHTIRDEELEAIKAVFDGKITIMETRKTAYGNMVLANDHGAVVDPRLKATEIKLISETLDVEALPCEIAGLPYVGSLAVATNKGVLAHPLLKDSERKILEDVLKVPVEVGTINCGVPYVGAGLICNSYAAVAGTLTTGPEMFIIGNALDVVSEEEQSESFQNIWQN